MDLATAELLVIAVAVIALPTAVAHLERRLHRSLGKGAAWKRVERMPDELASAEIYMSEAPVSMTRPFAAHGRVDQVFLARRGVLVVLDTKYRASMKETPSDVFQVSCYAAALRQGSRLPVARHGYIRLVNEVGSARYVHYRKVRLLSERDIVRQLRG